MIAAIEQALAEVREQLDQALVAADVWSTRTGLGYASYESSPATGPMLNTVVQDLRETLAASGSGELDDLVVLDLYGKTAVVLVCPPGLGAVLVLDKHIDLASVLTTTVPELAERLRTAQAEA
ncbi:MAG: hypothetical protein Q4G45_04890 [Actinomycetia bacterium]|nr:hypothetical protein [Actinomycetes bacterium]